MRGTSARPPASGIQCLYESSWILSELQLNRVFCRVFCRLPWTVSLKRGKTLFQALIAGSRGVNPFGWATIDTCAISGKHRSAIIGERRPRHRWPRSWGLVPSGTGGTGLIATFMAPRGRLMHGRWRRSKLSSFPSFPPHSSDLTNASESLAKMNASLNEIFLKKFDGLVKIVVYEI